MPLIPAANSELSSAQLESPKDFSGSLLHEVAGLSTTGSRIHCHKRMAVFNESRISLKKLRLSLIMPVYVFKLRRNDPSRAGMARDIIHAFIRSKYSNVKIKVNVKHGRVEFPLLDKHESEIQELRDQLTRRKFGSKEYDLDVSYAYQTVDEFYASMN